MTTDTSPTASRDDDYPPNERLVPELPPPEDLTVLDSRVDAGKIALIVLATLAVIFSLQWAALVLIPLVISILLSYALNPVVTRLWKWGLHRAIGAALVILAIVFGIGTAGITLGAEFAVVVEKIPEAVHKFTLLLKSTPGNAMNGIDKFRKAADELGEATDEVTGRAGQPDVPVAVDNAPVPLDIVDYLWTGSLGLMAFVGQTIIVVFTTYFLLVSGDMFKRKLVKIRGPTISKKRVTVQILDEIDQQIQRFMAVQLFTSFLVGIISWLVFRWIGLEQAGMWGLVAGIFNSIPYLGPVVVTGGTALVALMQFGTFTMALLVGGLTLLITSLEGFLLTPWLTSRAGKMNAVVIFVGVLFWGWLWGVWGLLLGIPILMAIKAVCDHIEDLQPIGELLGD